MKKNSQLFISQVSKPPKKIINPPNGRSGELCKLTEFMISCQLLVVTIWNTISTEHLENEMGKNSFIFGKQSYHKKIWNKRKYKIKLYS